AQRLRRAGPLARTLRSGLGGGDAAGLAAAAAGVPPIREAVAAVDGGDGAGGQRTGLALVQVPVEVGDARDDESVAAMHVGVQSARPSPPALGPGARAALPAGLRVRVRGTGTAQDGAAAEVIWDATDQGMDVAIDPDGTGAVFRVPRSLLEPLGPSAGA
ncbi:unnamed protein product, partial [Prorocentrum cordatum]